MAHKQTLAQRINILRASVMGANDGILSVAGIVIGVAGAATSSYAIHFRGVSQLLGHKNPSQWIANLLDYG